MNFSEFSHSELIISVIIALIVLGLLFQISAILFYGAEIKFIDRLGNKILSLLGDDDSAILSSDELLESEQIPEQSMVATRTRELEKFAQYPGMVALHDLGAVAAEADAGRVKNAVPNVLIASLLVFGLFGTLLSLKETLQDPALAQFVSKEGNASSSVFQESLGTVLDGFGRAFRASIWGVGGTIVLIVFRVFVRERRETCFERLEHFVVECLLPYYIEPEKTQLQKASASITESTSRFRDTSNVFDKSAEAISSAVTCLESSIAMASKTFGEEGAVAYQLSKFTEQADLFNQSAEKVGDAHANASETLSKLIDSQKELIEKQESRIASAEENKMKLTERLSDFLESVSEDNLTVKKEFNTGVRELVDAQNASAKTVEERGREQEEHFESLIKNIENNHDTLTSKLHEDYVETSNQIVSLNKSLVEENSTTLGAVVSNLESLSSKLEQIALKDDRVDLKAFSDFRMHLANIENNLVTVIADNSQAIAKSQDIHRKFDEKMIKSLNDFSSRVTALTRLIDKIAEAGSIEQNTMKDKILNIFRR